MIQFDSASRPPKNLHIDDTTLPTDQALSFLHPVQIEILAI